MPCPYATGLQRAAAVAAAAALLGPAAAQAYVVPGSANPNLAGRAAGYACCLGDSAPAQSPVLAGGLALVPGAALQFSVTGQVTYGGGAIGGNNPDGDEAGSMTTYGDGLSAPLAVRFNALYGVFLTDADPTGSATPAVLNYAGGLDFTTSVPGIGQIFFIGDGLTSDTDAADFGGMRQSFIVPAGATRLFFGTGDGFGWYNNGGSFTVSLVGGDAAPMPAPSSPLLLALGLAMLWARRYGARGRQ